MGIIPHSPTKSLCLEGCCRHFCRQIWKVPFMSSTIYLVSTDCWALHWKCSPKPDHFEWKHSKSLSLFGELSLRILEKGLLFKWVINTAFGFGTVNLSGIEPVSYQTKSHVMCPYTTDKPHFTKQSKETNLFYEWVGLPTTTALSRSVKLNSFSCVLCTWCSWWECSVSGVSDEREPTGCLVERTSGVCPPSARPTACPATHFKLTNPTNSPAWETFSHILINIV